jgi:hypothetical protein
MKSRKVIKDFSLQLGPGVTADIIMRRLNAFVGRVKRLRNRGKRVPRHIRKRMQLEQRQKEKGVSCS